MEHKENRTLHSEEDMVALAEELAAQVPLPVSAVRAKPLPAWMGYAISALCGAGAVGLWWFLA